MTPGYGTSLLSPNDQLLMKSNVYIRLAASSDHIQWHAYISTVHRFAHTEPTCSLESRRKSVSEHICFGLYKRYIRRSPLIVLQSLLYILS